MKHTDTLIGQPSNNGNNVGPNKINVAAEIKFETDTQGYPMLPSWETIKDRKLLHKKILIGKFLAEMHGAYFLLSCCLLGHLLSLISEGCQWWQ
jgi:hypothetical protein